MSSVKPQTMQRSAQNTNANAKAALVEAQEIEAIVQTLMGRAGAHAQRIERMKSYCQGVGVALVPYRWNHLERRITAIFHGGGSVVRAYEHPYQEILKGNIAAVERQIKPITVSTSTDGPADSEVTASIEAASPMIH